MNQCGDARHIQQRGNGADQEKHNNRAKEFQVQLPLPLKAKNPGARIKSTCLYVTCKLGSVHTCDSYGSTIFGEQCGDLDHLIEVASRFDILVDVDTDFRAGEGNFEPLLARAQ